jgi:hypothetical protein
MADDGRPEDVVNVQPVRSHNRRGRGGSKKT